MKIIPYRPDIGQEYYNPFKEKGIYPFCEIGRCITNKDSGEIKRWCHELDSTLDRDGNDIAFDKNTEDYMVYIPAFYYKRVWEGDVLKDSILTRIPDTVEYEGYKVHPAFIKKDGTIRKYILIGAFPVSIINNQCRSVPEVNPWCGQSVTSYRDRVRQGRGINFNVITFYALNCIRLLFKIAFSDLNVRQCISTGFDQSANCRLGTTLKIGNVTGVYERYISIFGIENLYGRGSYFVDGILMNKFGYYVTNEHSDMGDIDNYKKVEGINELVSWNGSFKSIKKLDKNFIFLDIVDKTGSISEGYCSVFNIRVDSEEGNYKVLSTQNTFFGRETDCFFGQVYENLLSGNGNSYRSTFLMYAEQ